MANEKLHRARANLAQKFSNLQDKFTEHPQSNHQSYGRHLWESLKTSGLSFGVSLQYLVHGFFPFWFFQDADCDHTETETN